MKPAVMAAVAVPADDAEPAAAALLAPVAGVDDEAEDDVGVEVFAALLEQDEISNAVAVTATAAPTTRGRRRLAGMAVLSFD
ncbi:MAG: hypothetical protein QOG80_2163 [Pseudonocardiales bacterium]|nr:hypothetical protein [Pseudonocardiales bacterium]